MGLTMNNIYDLGTIILYKNISTWTGVIQRFWWRVTRQPYRQYSHLSIFAGVSTLGRELEAEANTQVDQTTFKYNQDSMDLFFPLAEREDIVKALNEAIDTHEEKLYGFISWLTIVIRGLFEMLGFKDVKGWNILWGWGVMCSEFGWYFMDKLSKLSIIKYDTENSQFARLWWINFRRDLLSYNPNTFTPIDARVLFANHPEIWRCTNDMKDKNLSYDLGVVRGYR